MAFALAEAKPGDTLDLGVVCFQRNFLLRKVFTVLLVRKWEGNRSPLTEVFFHPIDVNGTTIDSFFVSEKNGCDAPGAAETEYEVYFKPHVIDMPYERLNFDVFLYDSERNPSFLELWNKIADTLSIKDFEENVQKQNLEKYEKRRDDLMQELGSLNTEFQNGFTTRKEHTAQLDKQVKELVKQITAQ